MSERQARRVAEEARESEWKLPSFCRELFLGALRIDLIHPQPKLDEALARKGEAFLRRLGRFLDYAGGDVANAQHPFYDTRIRVEHWANALNQGPAAASNMLGQSAPYDRIP